LFSDKFLNSLKFFELFKKFQKLPRIRLDRVHLISPEIFDFYRA
jgi:hypothetical protein